MSAPNTAPHPWIFRLAVLTAVLVQLPIVLGALTTTYNAGMAFPDWPTSDGQGMFSYPWLRLISDMGTDPESFDKFLEHGHRLAGIVIGLAAIALAVVCWTPGSTPLLKKLGPAVLLMVIVQGLLGGYRVELNQIGLAMIHGLFASLVFSLMCVTCTAATRTWYDAEQSAEQRPVARVRWVALAFWVFLLVQYALGGMIRHPIGTRSPVHEHLGIGLLALILVHVVLVLVVKTKSPWLRSPMRWLLIVVGFQVLLGLATYAAKFGVPALGIVAVAQSTGQVLSRTSHMVTGVLVMGAATVLMVRAFRLHQLLQKQESTV